MASIILLLLSSLGLLTLLKASINLLKWVYTHFIRAPKDLKSTYGSWAVITGATDGIGKALAFELARHGLRLVLVARNPGKLSSVSDEIRSDALCRGALIKTVELDFSGDVGGGVRRLEAAIGGLDVGVLVNNVGATYPSAMYLHEVGEGVLGGVVRVNVEGTTAVTRAVVRGMVERRRGAVVNIGSGAAVVVPSFPLYAVYAATKAYIDQLSRSLYVEYKDMGIDVQCQIPLYVATKMVSFKRPSAFVPSADKYARSAVRWIGYESRCTPYWIHSIQWWLCGLIPDFALNLWLMKSATTRRKVED